MPAVVTRARHVHRAELRARAIRVLAHRPEEFPPDDHFDDAESLTWIQQQVAAGNTWAWCQVTLSVSLYGLVGVAYLGGVTCDNETTFRASGEYADLWAEAIEDLATALEQILQDRDLWCTNTVGCMHCISHTG